MIRGVSEIGKLLKSENSLIDGILKSDKYDYAFILKINLDTYQIDVFSNFQELDKNQIKKLKWIGNFKGSGYQAIITTDKLDYLITQSIPGILANFKKMDNFKDSKFKKVLEIFLKEAFITTNDKKYYKYILDIRKFRKVDGLEIASEETKRKLNNIKNIELEKIVESIRKDILGYIKERVKLNELPKKLLFSLEITKKIDNEEVVVSPEHPDYALYLKNLIVQEHFKSSKEGICHICRSKNNIANLDTKYFKLLKFYITDKKGFASSFIEENFTKNFGVCRDCYENLLIGENFVLSNFLLNYKEVKLYIFPEFLYYNSITKDNFEIWSKAIKDKVNVIWEKVGELEYYLENNFLINLVFATSDGSAVKIDKVIYDIPLSRLDELINVQKEVYIHGEEFFGLEKYWNLEFKNMLYLLPIRKRKDVIEIREFLEFLDNLISGRKFDKVWLFSKFVDTARIHRYKNYDNYVQSNAPYVPKKKDKIDDKPFLIFILQSNLLLYYLRILGQIETKGGECAMCDELLRNVDNKELLEYVDFLKLEPVERGLFLVGYLVAKIGTKQYKEGSEDKPILSKINFQSMNEEKVKTLLNEILEKLRQYKILDKYNETIYSIAKCYLDGNREKLKDGINNVYWILSGYAYGTYKAIVKKEVKDGI